LKITTLRVVSGPKSALRPKPAMAQPRPPHPQGKTGDASAGHVVAGEDRRRSQRVMLRVRAQIHVALQGKTQSFEVTTQSVNDHGAMVIMDRGLPPDTRMVLEHANTKERVACKVVRAARETPEGFQVPVEFDSPAPHFWRIAFPPSDWRPDET